MRLSKIDKMVELQARIYEMPNFDLTQIIQKSKTSSQKMTCFKPLSSNQKFSLFPILEILVSKSGNVALLILPDEKCLFVEDENKNNGVAPEKVIKNLSVGFWVITEEEEYTKGVYDFKAFLCERTQAEAFKLMADIQKASQSEYNNTIFFGSLGSNSFCYTLQSIRDKVRELGSDGKKYAFNNLRARNYGEGEKYSNESNILFNLQFILDGKAEVNSYGEQ